MGITLALVHHANQYLITDGYDNRPGLMSVLGSERCRTGLSRVLDLHRTYKIPANIHISGTLLEAVAWHQPAFLRALREMYAEGLIEFLGSSYGQNILPFSSYAHNLEQLNEELRLYELHLGLDPACVKTFWPPERLWDTGSMGALLKDMRLLNRGYDQVIVDDRILLPFDRPRSPRRAYDRDKYWHLELFRAYRIAETDNLTAIPISYNLRHTIPPRSMDDWNKLQAQMRCLAALQPNDDSGDFIAVYGDDMEKAAGVGPWDTDGVRQFEELLRWIQEATWIQPVKIQEWISRHPAVRKRTLETGTYVELANHFHAGEDYGNWYMDPQWKPYSDYLSWSESRVKELASLGADRGLISLAEKHLLASNWETAWHTPASGAHGSADGSGAPSPWVRAVASHSRHAAAIAEAAFWMHHRDGLSHAYVQDIDGDNEQEVILKNANLFAIFSPAWGGRLVFLFDLGSERGSMVIGNPSDDWNWMEELNRFMETPRNHPGALADVGFENHTYTPSVLTASGPAARVRLTNSHADGAAYGLVKEVCLPAHDSSTLIVTYTLPDSLDNLTVEFGLSPDYFNLLRHGRTLMEPYNSSSAKGFCCGETAVSVRTNGGRTMWVDACPEEFGHGGLVALRSLERHFAITIEVTAKAGDTPRQS